MISLLTGGHVLMEGPPGRAKTTAVNTLASGVNASFQRVQFTPDLMPGDLTGTEIFDPESHRFTFVNGPIFHEIVLADEINRAPPTVQSALLEAMAEHQVTVGGVTHRLPELFVVLPHKTRWNNQAHTHCQRLNSIVFYYMWFWITPARKMSYGFFSRTGNEI